METPRALKPKRKQPKSQTATKRQLREEQPLNASIITLLVAVLAILVLLAATLIFVKLSPTVNFGLLILFFIVVAVIVFGPLNILTGEQITQLFTQLVAAITQISGAISGKTGTDSSSDSGKAASPDAASADTSSPRDTAPPLPSPSATREDKTPRPPLPPAAPASSQFEERHPYAEPSRDAPPPPEDDVDYPSRPANEDEEEKMAISLVKSCFTELMRWKKSVDFAASNLFVGGKLLDDELYTFQQESLGKIYSLSSNLNTYIEHLSKNNYARSAPLLGTIYNIQTISRQLRIYISQTNRSDLQGEIQHQFKVLSEHFTLLEGNFKRLGI